jgi:hypothetical protein
MECELSKLSEGSLVKLCDPLGSFVPFLSASTLAYYL